MVAYRSASLTDPPTDHEAVPPQPQEPMVETWQERLYAALPLFIVGGACLVLTFDFYLTRAATGFGSSAGVRLQPWTLFLALAITGLAAGTFAMIVGDEEPEVEEPTASPVSAVASAPAPTPEWDESVIEPEAPTYLPTRTWERPADSLERVQATSVPPDVVLQQIAEIEASLRKKKSAPSSEGSANHAR